MFSLYKHLSPKASAGKIEKIKERNTVIPHSELALYLEIAGKTGRVVETKENWAIVELNGKTYEGLCSELVDIRDRQK